MKQGILILIVLGAAGCAVKPKDPLAALPEIRAELIASDASWGNTEGPALDSHNNLYFTSRGSWKGIVRWNAAEGARRWAEVAVKAGPGGLWIDGADNVYLTATDEREVWKVGQDKTVSVVAKAGFEADPKLAKGPNDLIVAQSGRIYFTDPNGYYGDAPNGTVYLIDTDGTTRVFSTEITGPNGIMLSVDEKILYVAHNVGKDVARISSWALRLDGTAGGYKEVVTVPHCVADGMAIDQEGALWLTCYGFGVAYRVRPDGLITHRVTTAQKALTNVKFGRGEDRRHLYLTSSDMDRVTGYVYRAEVPVAGHR